MYIYTIRLANQADTIAINQISIENGLSDGSDMKLEPMDENNIWIVLEENEIVIGSAYFGLEGHSDRVWNLYFLAISKEFQGGGRGSALVIWAEEYLQKLGSKKAKLLIIETSSVEGFELTRKFYNKLNYKEVARVPDYYGENDDKVVFWKKL